MGYCGTHVMNNVGLFVLFEAVGNIEPFGAMRGINDWISLDPDDCLIRLDQIAVPAHADRGQNVVSRDHDGVDVGVVELFDGAVGFVFDQVLHDDQTQEVRLFLQAGPGHVVDGLPVVGVDWLVGGGQNPQTLSCVPLQGRREIRGN